MLKDKGNLNHFLEEVSKCFISGGGTQQQYSDHLLMFIGDSHPPIHPSICPSVHPSVLMLNEYKHTQALCEVSRRHWRARERTVLCAAGGYRL